MFKKIITVFTIIYSFVCNCGTYSAQKQVEKSSTSFAATQIQFATSLRGLDITIQNYSSKTLIKFNSFQEVYSVVPEKSYLSLTIYKLFNRLDLEPYQCPDYESSLGKPICSTRLSLQILISSSLQDPTLINMSVCTEGYLFADWYRINTPEKVYKVDYWKSWDNLTIAELLIRDGILPYKFDHLLPIIKPKG